MSKVDVIEYLMSQQIHNFDSKMDFFKFFDDAPKKYKRYVKNKYLGIENNYIKYGSEKCPAYKKLKEMGVSDYKAIFEESEIE